MPSDDRALGPASRRPLVPPYGYGSRLDGETGGRGAIERCVPAEILGVDAGRIGWMMAAARPAARGRSDRTLSMMFGLGAIASPLAAGARGGVFLFTATTRTFCSAPSPSAA